ncbi:MAG: DUF2141 domain-containing protein [Sphingomonas sp.]
MCRVAVAACLLFGLGTASAASAATLRVTVTNVRNVTGTVHIDVCRQSEFLKKCAVIAEARAVKGATVIIVENLPPGDYAVQGTYDENGNGKVDRALFGIPKEGVGFSNDAPIRLGPPKWSDAQFLVEGDKTITFKMRYFFGGNGK